MNVEIRITLGLTLLIGIACGTEAAPTDTSTLGANRIVVQRSDGDSVWLERQRLLDLQFRGSTLASLKDTLSLDLDGDGNADKIFLSSQQRPSGMTILLAANHYPIFIGFGKPFAHLTDLDWVDFWGYTYDSTTTKVLVEKSQVAGSREIKLQHPSIIIRSDDFGGGLISFIDGTFQWVHQAD